MNTAVSPCSSRFSMRLILYTAMAAGAREMRERRMRGRASRLSQTTREREPRCKIGRRALSASVLPPKYRGPLTIALHIVPLLPVASLAAGRRLECPRSPGQSKNGDTGPPPPHPASCHSHATETRGLASCRRLLQATLLTPRKLGGASISRKRLTWDEPAPNRQRMVTLPASPGLPGSSLGPSIRKIGTDADRGGCRSSALGVLSSPRKLE